MTPQDAVNIEVGTRLNVLKVGTRLNVLKVGTHL